MKPAPEKEYEAILSYLPPKSFWAMPQFFYCTRRIQTPLKSARGLVGYSLLAHVVAKRFWTLSIWQDEVSLMSFVHKDPHRETMVIPRRLMAGTYFVRWKIIGSAVRRIGTTLWSDSMHGNQSSDSCHVPTRVEPRNWKGTMSL